MLVAMKAAEPDAVGVLSAGLGLAYNIGTAALLLCGGFIFAGLLQRFVRQRLERLPRFDRTLIPFLSSIARYLIMVLTVVAVLSEFGVQTTSIVAVLGAAGLAVGLALQGTLSNVASGIMLLVLRPFQIGDYVDAAGTSGTVQEIGLFVTVLRTPQNVKRTVPNSMVFTNMIANYNAYPRMRVDFEVGISYDDDIALGIATLEQVIADEPRFLTDPAPRILTKALADSSVNLEIRAWVAQDDYFSIRFDLTRAIKTAFDAAGVSIPYPHRQIVMSQSGVGAPEPATPAKRKTTTRKPATRKPRKAA